MKVEPAMVRTFYEMEAEQEHWPVEHLERQIHTLLHLRLLKSRDKDGVMELARKGQTVEKLVDLKLGKLTHQDVGQMDSYVRLFDAHARTSGDGPTIGLILCAQKTRRWRATRFSARIKQLFAAKYVTYLPTEEELKQELERDRRIAEAVVRAAREEKATKPKRRAQPKGRKK